MSPRFATGFVLLALVMLSGCGSERALSERERCAATGVERCESAGCELTDARRVAVAEPTGDDDCFGEPTQVCVVDAARYAGDAMCVYVYRDDEVLRLGAPELPEDWTTCSGSVGEPAGCSCRTLGACGR